MYGPPLLSKTFFFFVQMQLIPEYRPKLFDPIKLFQDYILADGFLTSQII